MSKKYKILLPVVVAAVIIGLLALYISTHSIPVLQPRGPIGHNERTLLIIASLLAVIVVVPTFALTIYIAIKYREENHTETTKYKPDFDHSRLFESIWWGIPIVIIGVLSVITWVSSHQLDPYKSIASKEPTLNIDVIALDWKWLFIYPQQNLASVNLAVIPVDQPVDFYVTSDTVMNSFWVPQLGGQIYAMPGMITQLHELASQPGNYLGSPANISGAGFSRMDFTVRATSSSDFDSWATSFAARASKALNTSTYNELSKPSDNTPVAYYSPVDNNLFENTAMKYMMPMPKSQSQTKTTTQPTSGAIRKNQPATTGQKNENANSGAMSGMRM